jgi:drug/metabolite transporter (DMT)-like permease
MDLFSAGALVALGIKLIDVIGFTMDRKWGAVRTQLTAWAAGIAITFLAASSDVARSLEFGGHTLQGMSIGSLILVGLSLLSTGSLAVDAARGVQRTAASLALLTPPVTTLVTATATPDVAAEPVKPAKKEAKAPAKRSTVRKTPAKKASA